MHLSTVFLPAKYLLLHCFSIRHYVFDFIMFSFLDAEECLVSYEDQMILETLANEFQVCCKHFILKNLFKDLNVLLIK